MNMDQKQKQISGPRFNIFDFLIILGIVVCMTAIIVRLIIVSSAKEDVVFADVYFQVEDVSESTATAICVPYESIYLQSNDVRVGLFGVPQADSLRVWTEDENGVLVEALHPDRKTVSGKIQLKGVWRENGFWVEGTYLAAVGQTLDVYTKYASCTITITGIEEK